MVEAHNNFSAYSIDKERDSDRICVLSTQESEELGLVSNSNRQKETKEIATDILQVLWKNPETQTERNIEINIAQEIELFEKIYYDNLQIKIECDKIFAIWNSNFESIKKEIEVYGYDTIVIVPENLPMQDIVNEEVVETMYETATTSQVNSSYYGIDKNSITSLPELKYKIILTKSDQNIELTTDPFLKSTLGKNIMDLTGLNNKVVEKIIQQKGELPVNYKTKINNQEIEIKAEGMSLEEYMIFQRAYFKKTGKHLDESGWTWLTKSFGGGSSVVDSHWSSATRQLLVSADDVSFRVGSLGLRLSRSFS